MTDHYSVLVKGFSPNYTESTAGKNRVLWHAKKDANNSLQLNFDYVTKKFNFVKRINKLWDYTNLVTNGNFSNGTTGWAAAASTISAANNTMSIVGDGSQSVVRAGQSLTGNWIIGNKYYFKASAKVTNSVCGSIVYGLRDGSLAGTNISYIQINTPAINTIYSSSAIVTNPSYTGARHFAFYHAYTNASTPEPAALNKVMEVQSVIVLDLTTIFGAGNEPDQTWCDTNLPFVITSGTALATTPGNQAVLSTAARTFNKNQVHSLLAEQTPSGMSLRVLKSGGTTEKVTNSDITAMHGHFSLYPLTKDATGNEADAFLHSIKVMPAVNFTDNDALTLMSKGDERFNINNITLHANATRANGIITLVATAGWQISYLELPVFPNTNYIVSGSVTTPDQGVVCRINIDGYKDTTNISGNLIDRTASFTNVVFTTPANCNKIRINLFSQNAGTFNFSNISFKLKM
jgi:hypothetical protein